ncbi:formyltetrahydrofolate deformylase [Amycolatopsis pithecellobii]|uniref:Formyltetrahydrofolate deformylase n=1 Tax=Amycolatopsis pithecellobii TaxID=664692 RepID=A0A6N7YX74_9PSEU|nr:formyltetrahydrofolate deformylase [Amycolatopsis pithecellobii]MTD56488.1 formyltetrahydrofolate deformylase [Amycolatopsis pithecellobii]
MTGAVLSALRAQESSSGVTDTARLLVSCADRPGIVAGVSRFLVERGANIVQSDQYSTNPESGSFFLRVVFHLPGVSARLDELSEQFAVEVAQRFGSDFEFHDAARPKRVAIMVSRYDHCLLDLLWRTSRGELPMEIGAVVSNWGDLRDEVTRFGVPYHEIPVTRATKATSESAQLDVLGGGRYDLVILARYMQILSDDFLRRVGCPVINIHHSFLPAFAGAGPYERAKERGVKLIGATAHYATADLDEGPIIEQDVTRVSHRATTRDLVRAGADVERSVLQRAVRWHCEDRVLLHGNTTVVF